MEFRTLGIVLQRHSTGEADRVLKVFTRDFGLIGALAKGVKKLKSRQAHALELFSVSNLRLHRRSGELFLLTGTTLVRSFPTNNFEQLAKIYELAAWCLKLLPLEKPLPEVFALLESVLKSLPDNSVKSPQIILATKAKLLTLLGYLPEDFEDQRVGKLLRFCAAESFSRIQKIVYEEKTFKSAEKVLREIFEEVVN